MSFRKHNFTIHERGITIFISLAFAWWLIGFVMIELFSTKELFTAFNDWNNDFLNKIMPVITTLGEGWVMSIFIIAAIVAKKKFRNFKFLVAAALCLSIPSLFTNIIKRIINAPRPLKFWGDASWIHTVPGYEAYHSLSHPSGHTTGAFSLFCFLSFILGKKYAPVAIIYFVLAMFTGFSRIYLAQHFFDDVWAGSIMGTAVSYIIFHLFYLRDHD